MTHSTTPTTPTTAAATPLPDDAPSDDIEVPFLVVGAGPVGLTAAQLLANAGHRCLVVDRRDGPQRNPAAHVVNARTLEIFRQAGFDMDAIAGISQDPRDGGHVNFVTRLNGTLIGRLPFERQGDENLALTPTPLRNISQHRLEPLLASTVAARDEVDLRYDVEWIAAEQNDDGVVSTLRDLRTDRLITVRSRWLLAADGAGSRVRKWLGIEMDGLSAIQSFVAIHLMANLRSYVDARPGALHFVMDPEVAGTFIAHDVDHEWVYMVPFDPTIETIDDYPEERCVALIRGAIGLAAAPAEPGVDGDQSAEPDIDIAGVGTWHMTAQVAERFRNDRVFLVGDAAHRFPPTGGMGLNTGVGDAHNLVWKLTEVDSGRAGRNLLATYEAERRPIALTNCAQSTTNAFKMVILADALGLSPGATGDDLARVLADPERHERIDAAVAEQATHFDMLGLQLGFVYAEGALHRPGPPPTPIEDPTPFDPHAEVGARLPHDWLPDGRSTLDLVDGSSHVLLSAGRHDEWASAAASVATQAGGTDGAGFLVHLRVGDDVAVSDEWRRRCSLADGDALLVRPDQHIAWRSDNPAGLAAIVDEITFRESTGA